METVSSFGFVLNDHDGQVNDADLDYSGKRLATCSSDKTIKIYSVHENKTFGLLADIKGHHGPVWQISWSHPASGELLASCSYDKRIIVWKELDGWNSIYEFTHNFSVNVIAWSPYQFGTILASAGPDGLIGIHVFNKKWTSKSFKAHQNGCNTISWAPYKELIVEPNQAPKYSKKLVLASGGCDNSIKIWTTENVQSTQWVQIGELNCHKNWIRNVAWTSTIDNNRQLIASCAEDKSVVVSRSFDYTKWISSQIHVFDTDVCTVSWSKIGNVLAVCAEPNKISLWKENITGQWISCSEIDDGTEED